MSGSQPTRVLIIDADNVRRGMLACSLPATRYSLDFTKGASDGLDRMQEQMPEVVLIGHDDSTADLCQRIRSLPAAAHTLLVLMDESFRDEATGTAEAEAIGADLALAFPFPLEALEKRVERRQRRRNSELVQIVTTAPKAVETAEEQPPQEPSDPAQEWAAFRTRVQSLFDALDRLDYYQLLEVPRSASPSEVKDSYFERSIEFHPDRFMQLDDADLKQQLYQLFKRFTEAFKVLTDPMTRGEYEEQLASPHDGERQVRYLDLGRPTRPAEGDAADTSTPAGTKYLRLAELAERNGNLKSARMYLTLASQSEPDNARLKERLDRVTEQLGRQD